MDEYSDSSMDGSLNSNSYSTGTPEPAVLLSQSPESLFNMDFDETVPRRLKTSRDFGRAHEEQESFKSVHYENDFTEGGSENEDSGLQHHDMGEEEQTQDMSQSYHLNVSTDLVGTPILTNCNKISSFLSENGYQSVKLLNSDIDRKTGMISTFVMDSWAENVLAAIMEMQERVQSNRQTMSRVSTSSKQSEAGQEAQAQRMEELRAKLAACEQREKAALIKIQILEESQEKKNKSSDTGTVEHKRLVKNMETQLQEHERRCRTKDLEIERLKQKLAHIAEKERETNARNRQIVSQIKSGDVSFVNDNLQVSPRNKADSPTYISPQKVNNSSQPGLNSSFTSTGAASHTRSHQSRGSALPVSSSKSQQRVATGSTLSSQTAGYTPSTPVRGGSVVTNGTTTSNLVSLTAVVDALETQRRELGARNKELELQVRDLLLALKKQNNASSPSKTSRREESEEDESHRQRNSSQHSGMSATAQTMYLRLQEQQAEIEALQRQFELKAALLSEREETIVMQRERAMELHSEVENLRLELEGRPTMRQWTQAQRDREQLEEKLHDLILLRGEAAEISMWRQHLSTADRIKVDKRNHELGLWLLDSLPKATMKEVLQTVCRELDISEISEIHPSLVKLKAVVKVVPRMERFISQVCNFVFQRHPSLGPIDGLSCSLPDGVVTGSGSDGNYSMDHLLPILKRWWYAAQRCVELDAFHTRVSLELYRKQELLARRNAQHNNGGVNTIMSVNALQKADLITLQRLWESEGKQQWATRDPESVFQILRDLVDFQVEVMHHDQSLLYAENYILDRPEILVNRIIGHIQYLFEIKSLDGVLPRLNQVYLFVEEMRNFLKASRGLVDLEGHSTEVMNNNSMLLAEILRKLSVGSAGVTTASIIQ